MPLIRFRSLFLAVLIALIACAVFLAPVSAQAETIRWERFDVDVTILPNGDAQIVETQTILFVGGPFSEGYAEIPLAYTDGVGEIKVTQDGRPSLLVEGEPELPNTYSYDINQSFVEIVWKFIGVIDERKTFELAYTLKGVVGRYEGGDQLILTAISDDLEFPVYASNVTVHLPAPIKAEPESIGAETLWETSEDAQTVTFTAVNGVHEEQGIAINLFLQHDPAAAKPQWQLDQEEADAIEAQIAETLRLEKERQRVLTAQLDLGATGVTVALFLLLPAGLYTVWFLWGRDPSSILTPDYLAELPSTLPPGLVGVLIDERVDMRDLTATLIDLARRGHLTLEEVESGKFFSSPNSIQLKKTAADRPQGLRHYESLLYSSVFNTQQTVRLDQLPFSFFDSLPRIEAALYDETVTEGLFRTSPGAARTRYRNIGIGVIVGGIGLAMVTGLIWGGLTSTVILPALPIVLFGIGLIVLGPVMPARTRKGAQEASKWRVFQKYLGNIKQYGGVASAAEKFEAYLPYAVAFGLERRWVTAFSEPQPEAVPLVVSTPSWYRPRLVSQPQTTAASTGSSPLAGLPSATAGAGSPVTTATVPRVSIPGPAAASLPNLNTVGQGFATSLNQMGTNFVQALNTVGNSFASPRPSSGGSWMSSGSNSGASSSGGSWGGSYRSSSSSHRRSSSSRSSFGGSRGSSGGRSSFRSGGSSRRSSGGGRRGFR